MIVPAYFLQQPELGVRIPPTFQRFPCIDDSMHGGSSFRKDKSKDENAPIATEYSWQWH